MQTKAIIVGAGQKNKGHFPKKTGPPGPVACDYLTEKKQKQSI
jgi:hypothetical protein